MIGNYGGKTVFRIDYQYTETVPDGSVDKEDTVFFLAETPEEAAGALRAMKDPLEVSIGAITAVFDGRMLNYIVPPQSFSAL